MDNIALENLVHQNDDSNFDFQLPRQNLVSSENLFEVCKRLIKNVGNDRPFYQPFPYSVQQNSVLFCGSCITDNVAEQINEKLMWETKLEDFPLPNIDKVIENIKKIRDNNSVRLTKKIKQYIEHFHQDPYPMLSGNYNWLYTGGCLCDAGNSEATYLISGDSGVKKPGFSILKLNDTKDEIVQKSFCQLKVSSPVHQIVCRQKGENLLICVRQNHHLSVYDTSTLSSCNSPVKLWRKKVLSSKFLTCVDMEANCEKVIITDSVHDINIFDVERKNKIFGHPGRNIACYFTDDAWSQIEFGELGIYWALRNRFVLFDPRDLHSGTKSGFKISSNLKTYGSITSFTRSQTDANFIYLGTNDSVLQMDLRNGKAVQMWTHLMDSQPQFMTAVKDKEESEVLLLQSPKIEEIVGIKNERVKLNEKVYFVSESLPQILKSMKGALSQARCQGMCLNPSFSKRMNFYVLGMKCLKNNQGDLNLFVTNSGGDIFLSKIKTITPESFLSNEEKEIKGAEKYESHLREFQLKYSTKNHTGCVDMSQVLQDFKNTKAENWRKKHGKHEIYWKYHKKYSLKKLNRFSDPLAQKTLDMWIPPDMRIKEIDMEAEMKSIEEKVIEWLKTI